MNIFFTNPNPIRCAEYLDNARCSKMILESCQMLATAVIENGGSAPYKSTHKNHPSTKWATESLDNWLWLWNHMVALAKEHKRRTGKTHKSFRVFIQSDIKLQARKLIPSKGITEKPNCAARKDMGICYKHIRNIYQAYQLYLQYRWKTDKRIPKWS